MIQLPPLPEPYCCYRCDFDYHSTDQIEAYGIACARVVLEAAAKVCHGYLSVTQAAAAIRALEIAP